MKATLDTNTLASATLSADTPPGQILDAWRSKLFELVVSEYILIELERALQKPYFRLRISPEQRQGFLELLRSDATLTDLTVPLQGIATHPQDDPILATALSAKVDYLVTGDGPLIRSLGGFYEGVSLVTPREFLDHLQRLPE